MYTQMTEPFTIDQLKQLLSQCKHGKIQISDFPLSRERFFDYIVQRTLDTPDVYIEASLLKYIHLFPEGIVRFIFYTSQIGIHYKNYYGGIVVHLNLKDVTISTIRKYWIPFIQQYNVMVEHNQVENLSEFIRKIFLYFSSDVIQMGLTLLRPILNPTLVDRLHVLTKYESKTHIDTVVQTMQPISISI